MLRRIEIGNYKSITQLPIELGRFNVFIGENGAGKSNILEAIALASAAASNKLDNEFLASRGIRVTRSELMRAAFTGTAFAEPISIAVAHQNDERVEFFLANDNQPYSKWLVSVATNVEEAHLEPSHEGLRADYHAGLQLALLRLTPVVRPLNDFLIYSPENSALRTFDREGQIEPLGINGEGLLKLIHVHAAMKDDPVLDEIRAALKMLGWFEDFAPSTDINDERLIIRDRYIEGLPFDLDQKSANEGFLFLLFYFALFTSKLTPQFFAIDNIDASLNPKLCQKLTTELVRLSKANDKQVIVTTHNPAVLDGLNLDDDEQRLFVVSRGRDGATKLKRIQKPASDGPSYRLSELFLRGLLGGLPKGF